MSSRLAAGLAVALLALTACGGDSPAPAPSDPQTLALAILPPEADAAIVGATLALRVTATPTGGTPSDASDYVTWASSDERVATVDSHGLLTARSPGRVTVTASAKNSTANVTIDVVPNVAGRWSFVAVGTACDDSRDEGCFEGRPRSWGRNTVALEQAGHRVTGDWTGVYYLSGHAPFEGRVDIDGSLDLHAEYCSPSDTGASARFSLRDWHMNRAPDGTYAGQVTWEQAGPFFDRACAGEPRYRLVERLLVTDFRR